MVSRIPSCFDTLLTHMMIIALAFRDRIGGEKKINSYCHELAVSGGRCVAAILNTEVMDSDVTPGELTGNMVCTDTTSKP